MRISDHSNQLFRRVLEIRRSGCLSEGNIGRVGDTRLQLGRSLDSLSRVSGYSFLLDAPDVSGRLLGKPQVLLIYPKSSKFRLASC